MDEIHIFLVGYHLNLQGDFPWEPLSLVLLLLLD